MKKIASMYRHQRVVLQQLLQVQLTLRCLLFSLSLIPFFCRADKPFSCGILEYKPTTSTEHKTISLGKSVKEMSFFKKPLGSFM